MTCQHLHSIPTSMYLYIMKCLDTRERIVERMFTHIQRCGFQGLRADKVVADMDITKGALYHYFPNKQAIGLAVIDEIIAPHYLAFYLELNRNNNSPIVQLQNHLNDLKAMATSENINFGCPLNNLIQEMSPINENFRKHLKWVVDQMHRATADALLQGKENGFVLHSVDTDAVAHFFLASLEGSYGMAKVHQNVEIFHASIDTLILMLDKLRKN